jgi:hypothetical protein
MLKIVMNIIKPEVSIGMESLENKYSPTTVIVITAIACRLGRSGIII